MVKGAMHFSSFAFAMSLMSLGEATAAAQNHAQSSRTVEVRVLPNGRYLYKGKEITAREFERLGKQNSVDLVISNDFATKDPLYREMQEQAQRNGAYHVGFSGVGSTQNHPPAKQSNGVIPGRAKR